MYILFEGVDTSGKSTQATLLQNCLKNSILTKEPGGTSLGLTIRDLVLHQGVGSHKSELFLFLADRSEHFKEVILPNLDKSIISDRGLVSGISYALANHKDYDLDFLIDLNSFALDGTLPDKIVLLKTDKELIKSRMSDKKEDMIEKRGMDYLLKIQDLMINVIEKLDVDFIILDANESIETLHKKIKEFIDG
jgi:dTMP kinase